MWDDVRPQVGGFLSENFGSAGAYDRGLARLVRFLESRSDNVVRGPSVLEKHDVRAESDDFARPFSSLVRGLQNVQLLVWRFEPIQVCKLLEVNRGIERARLDNSSGQNALVH